MLGIINVQTGTLNNAVFTTVAEIHIHLEMEGLNPDNYLIVPMVSRGEDIVGYERLSKQKIRRAVYETYEIDILACHRKRIQLPANYYDERIWKEPPYYGTDLGRTDNYPSTVIGNTDEGTTGLSVVPREAGQSP